ncbi:MAG TPA: LysR family transcriptional regulator [Aromatoleum sp.]|uniref:LysR family transcriptional regulator n=1 Tax=Aromatoleum sp. TaxID=2307007 RepID=UPI002B480722|nr:LysR family transcriptional regulator [Aromatoleum sp.]HJV25820.1 LysR family transcriptional regulator [Aromatoleum sp.]
MIARKYLYLIALAREKHFGRAATCCHVSPSTLSAAIRGLEDELGVVLVERSQHFAGLTPEGMCVVEHAQRLAAGAEGLKQEMARLKGGLSGRLRIGVIPTALTVVASLTAPFAREHPRVDIEVLALATGDILARLRAFELDAGIVYSASVSAADLLATPVWQENHVFLTAPGGPLAGRDAVSWREASHFPLCLLTRDMQNRQTIDAVFASLDCQPKVSLETNSIITLLAHVCAGPWATIVPRSVLDLIGAPRDVEVLPLTDPAVAWETSVVTLARDPSPPMVAAFVAEARRLGGEG